MIINLSPFRSYCQAQIGGVDAPVFFCFSTASGFRLFLRFVYRQCPRIWFTDMEVDCVLGFL